MVIEHISEAEKSLIQEFRYLGMPEYGSINDNLASIDHFLRFWNREKTDTMGEVFKDSLILKRTVNIALEDDELYNKMRELTWTGDFSNIKDEVANRVGKHNDWLARQWGTANNYSLRDCFLYHLFTIETMVKNEYDGPTASIKLPSGKEFKLVSGAKAMKAMGRLVKEFAPEYTENFERIRIRQSQIMNEARLSANLCLSIHPLDYMTASYNANDWRSCMCWEDGEYRRGVIEMMNSPYVVVAYLESKSATLEVNGMHWNSKRWREFFIVRPEFISGIKGYPYWNRTLEDEALKWLKELFGAAYNRPYTDKITIFEADDLAVNDDIDSAVTLNMECGPAMYNDFYNDNEYHAILTPHLHDHIYTDYSGVSECIVCGEGNDFEESGDLVCTVCCSYDTCVCCGERIYNSYDSETVDGNIYCYNCYENLPSCTCCDTKIDPGNDFGFEFTIGRFISEESKKKAEIIYYDAKPEDVLLTPDWEKKLANKIEPYDYIARRAVSQHFCCCPDCADGFFKNGQEEFDVHHYYFSSWNDYIPIVPFDRIKDDTLDDIIERGAYGASFQMRASEAESA